jgi:DnaK suppressor protein
MNSKAVHLDKAFVDRQRERLITLRDERLDTTRAEVTEEAGIRGQSAGQAQEREDDAQTLTQLEIDDTLAGLGTQRLPVIERALEEIDAGTCGLSDVSGQLVPRERLEAMPEAICTVAEEEARRTSSRR